MRRQTSVKVGWHEVRTKPQDFPTNAEMQQRLFKAAKEADERFPSSLGSTPALRAATAVIAEIRAAYPGREAKV